MGRVLNNDLVDNKNSISLFVTNLDREAGDSVKD